MPESRSRAFEKLAHELKMSYAPTEEWGLHNLLKDFELFRRGHSKKITNLLRTRTPLLHTDIQIFDYKFTIQAGNTPVKRQQTVFFIDSKRLGLPYFYMKPETFLEKIETWLRLQRDINFESHPKFSSQYLLKGEDEDYIRATFTDEVLRFFTIEKGWTLEGVNYFLILYKYKQVLSPKEIKRLYRKGKQVADMLFLEEET